MHPDRVERELRQERRVRYRVRWVASPPPGARQPRGQRVNPSPYAGPPKYDQPPRWGFPSVVWRRPTQLLGFAETRSPLQKLRAVAPFASSALLAFTMLALLAGGSEIWRYVLLVQSRDSALSTRVVGVSDALVTISSLLAFGFALVPVIFAAWWLYLARLVVQDEQKETPARSSWQVVLGFVLPLFNLFAAAAALAELEHSAFGQSRDQRPKPSRILLLWWALWALNQVLLIIVLTVRGRGGLMAQTDGVLLAGLLDLSAAALAIASALLVKQLMRAIVPVSLGHFTSRQVLQVIDAPEPQLRPGRSPGAVR